VCVCVITRSRRLTSQLSLLSPIDTSLVELLVSNSRELLAQVSDRKLQTGSFGSAYNSPIGPANNVSCCRVGLSEDNCLLRFLGDACGVTAACSRNSCLWQDGGSCHGNHVNTCDVIAAACTELSTGQCVATPLRHQTMGGHVILRNKNGKQYIAMFTNGQV
jgi:hypothetical protein